MGTGSNRIVDDFKEQTMKHEPIDSHAERKRISALIEQCEKEKTMRLIDAEWLKQNFNTVFWSEIGKIIDSAPTIRTKQIKYFDEDEQVWKIGEVIVDE